MATRTSSNGTGGIQQVTLRPLALQTVEIPIVGETELIVHRWSEKARRQMLEAQQSKTRPKKEPKNPQEDYESSMYRLSDGGYGFPAAGFKAAIVGGCRMFEGFPMTQAKIAIRVNGEEAEQLVRINADPHMREDMVRLESGVADIRYRAGFFPWSATLNITFNANMLSLDALIQLVNAAGMGGVGEWRPSAPKSTTGSYGTFTVPGTL